MSDRLELKVVFAAIDKFIRPVKAITAGASEAAKALKANTDRMKEFNRTVEQIDAFKKVEKEAAITANTFTATRRKIDELSAAMAKAGVPTKAMAAEMDVLTKRSADLKAKHEALTTTEQRLFEKLKASGIDTRNLAEQRRNLASASAHATDESRKLSAALEAENQKMKRLRTAQADLQKTRELGGKLRSGGAKAMAAGAAINAAAAIPVMAYAAAEDSATQLKVAMMQNGGGVSDLFGQINDLAMKLGNKLPGTTADYQDMMTMLVRRGMEAKSILGGLGEATAYLAVQLKMAPTAAAEFASQLQNATRTIDKDMMGLMDTIQKTFYQGVDPDYMVQAFAKISPSLSILKKEGVDAARALAPLITLANKEGMTDGGSAGNAYRKIFQLSMDAKKVGKGNAALAGTGIKLDFTDGKGEFGGIDKMYAQLERLKGINTQKRLAAEKLIFGEDAETLQALTIMIERGVAGYRDVQGKMEAQAAIQERVNAQLKTLKSLWDAATGTFTNALVALGESVAPELHATAEALNSLAERTQNWAKENPKLSSALMTTVKWLGLAVLGVGSLMLAAGSIIVPLAVMKVALVSLGLSGAGSMGILSLAIKGVGLALRATGIGLALTAIGTAGMLIYENWDKVKALFATMFDNILVKLNQLKANLRYILPSVFGDMKETPTRASNTRVISASPILSQVATGSNYHFTINPGPATDNRTLAADIRAELERMDREKANRRRSALRDSE